MSTVRIQHAFVAEEIDAERKYTTTLTVERLDDRISIETETKDGEGETIAWNGISLTAEQSAVLSRFLATGRA